MFVQTTPPVWREMGSMNVADFMTPHPFVTTPDASLEQAWSQMERARIRHLPVVSGRALVGVLSDRDLLEATPSELATERAEQRMHSPVSVTPSDSAVGAAVEFILSRIGCLPVVEDGVLVGILSEFDVLRLYERVCREGGRAGELDPIVEQAMQKEVHHVPASTPLSAAREDMQDLGVRHVPVIEDGVVAGMLSDRDLRRANGDGAPPSTPVSHYMTGSVITVQPEERLSVAAARMAEHKVSALIVQSTGDRDIGLLTLTDVLDQALESLREQDRVMARDSSAEAT